MYSGDGTLLASTDAHTSGLGCSLQRLRYPHLRGCQIHHFNFVKLWKKITKM